MPIIVNDAAMIIHRRQKTILLITFTMPLNISQKAWKSESSRWEKHILTRHGLTKASDYGIFYQGEYEEAIENYLKCLSIRKTILQPSHAYTAEISYLLGEAYLKINQIHSAKEHLLLAEKIQA